MGGISRPLVITFTLALLIVQLGMFHGSTMIRCQEKERKALIEFKLGFRDPSNRLSSWFGEDCCTWEGVGCSNVTGRVIKLDLRNPHRTYPSEECPDDDSYLRSNDDSGCKWALHGDISPSLLSLQQLIHLDLSGNYFRQHHIPEFLGSFRLLTYLNLSCSGFVGRIPEQLGNLPTLHHLDLSYSYYRDDASAFSQGFLTGALSNLCKLQSLSLRGVPINDLLANLEVVFSGCLMFSLEELDLSNTQLSGSLPDWLGYIKNLKYLDLSHNLLCGSLPASLGNLSLLHYLNASSNHLNGTIAEGIGQLKSLIILDLHNNALSLSEVHLANLSSLKYLDISDNSLVINESHEWIPPFQLTTLYMAFCKIEPMPHFPKWLRTQKTIVYLDLTSVGIKGMISNWLSSHLEYLDLSNNEVTGEVPQYFPNLRYLDLSNNEITGEVPQYFPNLEYLDLSNNEITGEVLGYFPNLGYLDLSNNSLSGHLPPRMKNTMPNLYYLDLSMNNLSGSIPLSLCEIEFWFILRLSNNNLSGKLPNCWKNSSQIFMIDFASNHLIGGFPNSLCSLQTLQSLHLSRNNLSGQIPFCLKSCTNLITLDLGHNKFTGNISNWIGESLPHLKTLSLRSNAFTGSIFQLSHLASLQILDLSNNNFSVTIPSSFGNFSAMKGSPRDGSYFNRDDYNDYMWLVMKGIELEYKRVLSFVRVIDLSNNKLTGNVPLELGNLNVLHSLNLSGNYLTGDIPINVNGMQQLEALDLSRNNLSGVIPSSLGALNFLSHLNLSCNNLSGKIPIENLQPRIFTNPSIYVGNLHLCGAPLNKDCNGGGENDDSASKLETFWLCTSIALGFIVGFWIIWGFLLLQSRWRIAYFRAIDNTYEKLYVVVAVNMAKFKRELFARGEDD